MLKGLGGLGGLADMGKMVKAAQEMQTRLAALQEELGRITVTGTGGAGLVTATATAKGELTGLSIDPTLFRPEDREVVEDLILAAVRDAQAKAAERNRAEMEKMTADLGLPPGMKLPF
jgi:DNA-binding YbaB/EbfC family protein